MRHQYYELSSDSLDLCKGKLTPGVTATWGEIAGNIETQKDLVSYISAHGTAAWGSISGSITDQTDLIEYTDRFATISWIESKHLLGQMNGYTSDGQTWWMNFSTSEARISLMKWTSDPSNPGYFLNEVYTFISPQGMLVRNFLPSGSQIISIAGAYRSTYMRLSAMMRVSPIYTGIGMSIDETDGTPYMYISGLSSKVTFWDDHLSTGGINIQYSEIASKSDLSQYATRQWVTGRGYITSSALSGYATESWVQEQGYLVSDDLSQYATRQWVTGRGYITTSALSGYATESWVESQGYITASSLSGYIHFDESSPLSSIGKTLPFYSSTVGLFPVYQSFSSTWVNIEMTTNPVGWVTMGLACYNEDGSTEIWRDRFITENDMTGYVSRSYVDWRLVQEEGYPLSIYTLADENGNYTIGSLNDTTHAFTGIKVSGSQAGTYTVISSGLQYQESFDPFVTKDWLENDQEATMWLNAEITGWYNTNLDSDIRDITARLSALETNYGDALSITNNILS